MTSRSSFITASAQGHYDNQVLRTTHDRRAGPGVAAVAGVLLAAVVIGPATAAEPSYGPVTRTITVPYGDLDLRTEEGARSMLRRLSTAASRACADEANLPVEIARHAQARRACRSESLAAAVNELNSPKVSAAFAAAGGSKALKVAER